MEALIMACTTGGGHMSAAKAVQKQMESSGWKTSLLDPYTLTSKKLARMVGDAYVHLVQFSSSTFGQVYKIGREYDRLMQKVAIPDPVLEVQRPVADKLQAYLEKHPVDIIITTHMYPAFMLQILKQKGVQLPPVIMVATDYTCIPFEADGYADYVVIGSSGITDSFLKAGIPFKKLIPSGIPVDSKFENPKISKTEAAEKLGLNPQKKYILVSGGSMGSNTMDDAIVQIVRYAAGKKGLRTIVICGNNQNLYDHLKKLNNPKLIPVGFTEQMELYMAVSEVFVTKPGGLSITEAAAFGIPLLLSDPIPGCESANAQYFEAHGLAAYARSNAEIASILDKLLQPEARFNMRYAQNSRLPHNSARFLCDFASMVCVLAKKNQAQSKSD